MANSIFSTVHDKVSTLLLQGKSPLDLSVSPWITVAAVKATSDSKPAGVVAVPCQFTFL